MLVLRPVRGAHLLGLTLLAADTLHLTCEECAAHRGRKNASPWSQPSKARQARGRQTTQAIDFFSWFGVLPAIT